MPDFLGVPIIAPVIEDWTPDRAYETASGVSRIVTSDAHRFDVAFTLTDVDGQYRMASKLKSHYSKNRGVGFGTPMVQELYRGWPGADEYGTIEPTARTLARTTGAVGDASIRMQCAEALTLPEGWYVRFANHPKIYRITADVVWARANATVPVSLYPTLRKAVPNGTVVSLSPHYTCRYDPSAPLLVTNGARGVTTASVRLVEDI